MSVSNAILVGRMEDPRRDPPVPRTGVDTGGEFRFVMDEGDADQVRKLLEQGILTQAEFATEKRKILAGAPQEIISNIDAAERAAASSQGMNWPTDHYSAPAERVPNKGASPHNSQRTTVSPPRTATPPRQKEPRPKEGTFDDGAPSWRSGLGPTR